MQGGGDQSIERPGDEHIAWMAWHGMAWGFLLRPPSPVSLLCWFVLFFSSSVFIVRVEAQNRSHLYLDLISMVSSVFL